MNWFSLQFIWLSAESKIKSLETSHIRSLVAQRTTGVSEQRDQGIKECCPVRDARGTDGLCAISGYLRNHHWEITGTDTSSQALTWLPAQVLPVIKDNIYIWLKKPLLIQKEHTVFKDYCQGIHHLQQKSADVEVKPITSGIHLET